MRGFSRAFLSAALLLAALCLVVRTAGAENKVGPDSANYYRGTNAVEDQHIDILLAGGATNALNGPFVDAAAGLVDNATQLVDIGFSFNYYGVTYTKLYINLNGYLILEPPAGAPTPANADLTKNLAPVGGGGNGYILWSTDLPNAIIAPFLANLDFSVGNGTLLYQTVGSGTNKIFIAEWANAPMFNNPTQTISVQIQLHQNGLIYFVYDKVPDSLTDTTSGSRWTGLENENGTVGITYTTTQSSNPSLRTPYSLYTGLNLMFYSNQELARLTVVSAFGNPSPPVGDQVPRPKNSLVTAIVEPSVEVEDGVRWRCTGWVGSGSCPASWDGTGAPNLVIFEISQDSSITWQWIQEFRVQVTSLGDNGNPNPPAGDNWYAAFSQVTLSVTSPYQAWNCTGYTGTGNIGIGTETSLTVSINQASTIIWNWEYSGNLLSLGVISSFGSPSPAGLTLYTPGQSVTATVQPSITVSGEVYNCTGYNGTGSVPAFGMGNSVTFTILQNSTVTWRWQKQGGGTLQLTINSPFPPIPGKLGLYNNNETVAVDAQSPVEGDGYRWVCTGFTSTGSNIQAPSTSSRFNVVMTTNTTINFLWDIYYRLIVSSGTGDDLFGDPTLSVGGGAVLPVQPESWWKTTTMPFSVKVTSPYIPAGAAGVRYICLGWDGVGNIPMTNKNTTEVVFFMDQPCTITWLWQTEYQLTILNPRNLPGPIPSVGSYWHPAGANLVGNCIFSVGFYTCQGYAATGSLASSTALEYDFTINAPTTIEWVWRLDMPEYSAAEIIDPSTTGLYTSLAREPQTGHPWIAYFDSDAGDLMVNHYDGTAWQRQTVATIGTTGQFASLVLDNQNFPHIAYYNATDGDLWYARWTGVTWERILVDSDGDVGQYASISLITTVNGIVPAIAYYDATNRILKYAERSGSGFALQSVTALIEGDRGKYCSLRFDGFTNVPSIAYYDASNGDLMFASRISGIWSSEVVHSEGDVGRFATLAFNADNQPAVAYYDLTNRDLRFIQKIGGTWLAPVTVDADGDVGQFASLRFTTTNIPMIAYADYGREQLKFAYYNGVEWIRNILDGDGNNVGWYASLALDSYGNPGISYATATAVRYKAVPTPTTPQNPGGDGNVVVGGNGGGCFVATSAFGSLAETSVRALCDARDAAISSTSTGSSVVALYYEVSPAVASALKTSNPMRALMRSLLSE